MFPRPPFDPNVDPCSDPYYYGPPVPPYATPYYSQQPQLYAQPPYPPQPQVYGQPGQLGFFSANCPPPAINPYHQHHSHGLVSSVINSVLMRR